MPTKITFITQDGAEIVVEDAIGTLMEVATEHDVEGIDGDCGGVCSCSTCHVKVKREWLDKVGSAEEIEQDMLDLEDETDERRHYYGLTPFGREVLARETATLERIVAYAHLQEIV
jgi:2Fe-2S ferredoxin